MDAAEARRILGVKAKTLYTYVSRGWLRRVPSGFGRRSLYLREDVDRLRRRHDARAGHAAVASDALGFGQPVVDSAITRVGDHTISYRGHPVSTLLDRRFEDVAELLWTGDSGKGGDEGWPSPPVVPTALLAGSAPGVARLAHVVTGLALRDPDRQGAAPGDELARARRLIRTLASVIGPSPRAPAPDAAGAHRVAARLLRSLGGRSQDRRGRPAPAVAAIDRVLVLCADHELNPSAFAGRVAASTGADLYACLSASLATFSGPAHGTLGARVEALLDETGHRPGRAAAVLRGRRARGEAVPGFGHPLYPKGDPRVPPLVELARAHGGRRAAVRTLFALAEENAAAGHPPPSLDFGLVVVAEALGLPRGSASALFATGRLAGWVAHALEQRASGLLIRPRARVPAPPLSPADGG